MGIADQEARKTVGMHTEVGTAPAPPPMRAPIRSLPRKYSVAISSILSGSRRCTSSPAVMAVSTSPGSFFNQSSGVQQRRFVEWVAEFAVAVKVMPVNSGVARPFAAERAEIGGEMIGAADRRQHVVALAQFANPLVIVAHS